ncbi:MAG: hypothetical protein U0L83_06955 [Muribaculaceae bacterium]|nr:hypothetical protein [Muribaculaceae bacterium]
MKQPLAGTALAVSTMIALTGCIDNGYDLSDIDTTTEIKVRDLTLPINLETVVLSDIITVGENDDDKLREVTINGNTFYAVEETGTFRSDPLRIKPFSIDPDAITPFETRFVLTAGGGSQTTYRLQSPVVKKIEYRAQDIDEAIYEINYVTTDNLRLVMTFEMAAMPGAGTRKLTDISIAMPKGLTLVPADGRSYDPATGRMTVESLAFDASGRASLVFDARAIDLTANGARLDYATHSLLLDSDFTVNNATLVVSPTGGAQMPADVECGITYQLTPCDARELTGTIEYKLSGEELHIDPIVLGELPDFLSQEKTNLILHNPQIYLSLNNPLGPDRLYCQSGIELSAIRDDAPVQTFLLPGFRIGYDRGFGPYHFCLSPYRPDEVPEAFRENLKYVEFASLGNVLSGRGLPKSIGVELVDPKVPMQKVSGLELGRDLPCMEGDYKLLAPLALVGDAQSGSVIYYTDRKDGWNDEDIDGIVITSMKLTTEVTSTLPLNAVLTAHPIDKDGHLVSGVSVEGGVIPANAAGVPVTLTVTGEVRHLDGIEFTAEVRPDGTSTVLRPSQTIRLDKIRVNVSGSYTKEF